MTSLFTWKWGQLQSADSWSKGCGFETQQERQKKLFLHGQLSVLTLISVSVSPLCYCSSTQEILVILPKVQVADYSWTHMHPAYVTLNKMTLQTGAWLYDVHRSCAEVAAIWHHTSLVTTKQFCRYTISVDIQRNKQTKNKTHMHACTHARTRARAHTHTHTHTHKPKKKKTCAL